MSPVSRQRARIARVRHVQHDLAAAEAAQAQRKVQALELNAGQIARLRAGLAPHLGLTSGATMASTGELAMRLEKAGEGLARTIKAARIAVEAKDAVRLTARLQQESADKLKTKAAAEDEAAEERRIAASIRHRGRAAKKGDRM
ncbi:hypothetical protein IC614_01710 [Allosphingosinicella flava]|uniref:Flagellar FliJ protein n=1 Tax=Allosphingosinicella flava TaxID=2771430 RepID=A0A7T2GK58_9SPHN|nr:hypothetical protein [Sphingosinicella flava]QPQ55354.1 hypothetical protein IC614_01710 [Sphingosinicella flava]